LGSEGQEGLLPLLALTIRCRALRKACSYERRKDRSVEKIIDKILTVLGVIPALLLLFMVLSTSFTIFARFLGFSGLVWGVQFTEYALLWMTLLGATWVLKRDKHVTVDLITGLLKQHTKIYFNLVHSIMGFAVSGVLCWYGAVVSWGQYQRGVVDIQVIDVPKYLVLMVIPAGFFFLSLEFVRKFLIALKAIRGRKGRPFKEKETPVQRSPKTSERF
jgi:TRAP-type C4-dicarboxylate transport system permease small subunit